MRRACKLGTVNSLLLMTLVGGVAGCPDQTIGPDPSLVHQMRGQSYTDRDWAVVLRDHVRYGLVDYDTLRAKPEALYRYAALISVTGPESTPEQFPGRAQATAYYVNAYNALVLLAVLSQPPNIPTMEDISLPHLEEDYRFVLDGSTVTLNQVERKMLAASGGDVRTLLATSRAAMGTPRLPGEPRPSIASWPPLPPTPSTCRRFSASTTARGRSWSGRKSSGGRMTLSSTGKPSGGCEPCICSTCCSSWPLRSSGALCRLRWATRFGRSPSIGRSIAGNARPTVLWCPEFWPPTKRNDHVTSD